MVTPETCHTCGDVAVEARVVRSRGRHGPRRGRGSHESVAIELVAPVAHGDVLLCHAGIAIRKMAL